MPATDAGASGLARSDRFAAAVSCIDGRVHEPLLAWTRREIGVDHVDLVTQPGADGVLSACPVAVCEGIRERLAVSVDAHRPVAVVIAGHDECAANPVPAEQHRRDLVEAVREVGRWGLDLPVVGVWITLDGEVEEITRAGTSPAPAT